MAHFCSEVRYCLATSRHAGRGGASSSIRICRPKCSTTTSSRSPCACSIRCEHRLTLVNAGHLPPLRRRGGTVEELGDGEGGLAAGLRRASAATSRSKCRCEPGDTIVLYTDGISEAMNAQGDVYGSKRIREVIARAPAGRRTRGPDAAGRRAPLRPRPPAERRHLPGLLRPRELSVDQRAGLAYSSSWTSDSTPRGMQTVSTVRSPMALCFTPRGT